MYQTTEFINLHTESQAVIEASVRRLEGSGLQVIRSFDLKVARAAHVGCTCPHHGTDQCDCQLVVLLVYGQDDRPVTLVVHGYDGQTQVAMVETPEQQPSLELVSKIKGVLLPRIEPVWRTACFRLEDGNHAG